MKKYVCLLCIFTTLCCTTRVSVSVTKPSNIDMSEYRDLAIINTQYSEEKKITFGDVLKRPIQALLGKKDHNTMSNYVIKYTTDSLLRSLSRNNYFNIATYPSLNSIKDDDIDSIIQIEFTKIIFFDEFYYDSVPTIDPITQEYTEEEIQYIKREIEYSFIYKVLDIKGNNIITEGTFNDIKADIREVENKYKLKTTEELFESSIDHYTIEISKELSPYTKIERREILNDITNRKLKEAKRLVRQANYDEAYLLYIKEWDVNRTFKAGYNAAVILEILGNLPGAVNLMKEVVVETGHDKAIYAYSRLNRTMEDQSRIKKQLK